MIDAWAQQQALSLGAWASTLGLPVGSSGFAREVCHFKHNSSTSYQKQFLQAGGLAKVFPRVSNHANRQSLGSGLIPEFALEVTLRPDHPLALHIRLSPWSFSSCPVPVLPLPCALTCMYFVFVIPALPNTHLPHPSNIPHTRRTSHSYTT